MGFLTMKYNEEEMYRSLNPSLRPGEEITAAVYCSFQETGFLASNRAVEVGYLAVTGSERLIGVRSGLLSTRAFSYELAFLQKIKIRKGLFGARYLYTEGPEGKLKCVLTARVAGGKFPNHKENFARLLEVLEERQAAL